MQAILQQVHDAGDIYFGSYGGLYCTGCERFYTEKELVDGKCPDHKTAPEFIEEENYFFRMGKYQERLLDDDRAPSRADPARALPERGARDAARAARGPLHLAAEEPAHLGHHAALRRPLRHLRLVRRAHQLRHRGPGARCGRVSQTLWPAAQHFIAKDILKPHAVYWPTMLMAAGLPLYDHLNVHGYWTVDGAKMSKSLGNVVRPLDMQDKYGRDAFRYVLLRESVFGLDADFREDALVTRINADLANNIGNLVSRTLSMQQRYFEGAVQPLGEPRPEDDGARRRPMPRRAREVDAQVRDLMLSRALEAILRAADHANKYIVETAPFTLAKDPGDASRASAPSSTICWRRCARPPSSTAPFIPETRGPHRRAAEPARRTRCRSRAPLGHGLRAPGHAVQKPVPLFPRIEA